jgi:acetolactate synthase I/II/III large subunit
VKFHEAFARALRALDIDTVFGVMGDANLFIADSFVRVVGGRFVAASHEAGAVLMAAGYASVTGDVGVATVTHGAAVSNAVTSLIDAARSRRPLLVIAGDTPASDKHNLQNLPQAEIIAPTGAGIERVRTPETVYDDLQQAMRRAIVERRPIVLEVPSDFQWVEIQAGEPVRPAPVRPAAPDPEAVEQAVGLLSMAHRPVIVAGRGATTNAARDALLQLAERLGAPVATTLLGKDLFRGDAFDLGICGNLGHPEGLEAITRSDCIVAFGAGLNELTTDRGELVNGKRIIQCDIDPAAFGRYTRVDVAVLGDAVVTAQALCELLDEAELAPSTFRSEALRARLADARPIRSTAGSRPGTVDIADACTELEATLPAERTLVVDGGRFMFETLKRLSVPHPTAYVHTTSIASIGLGMGHAIGAAAGAPGRATVLVCGDGGFMLGGLAELNTAVRHGLDLVVVVMNDGAYGAEHVQLVLRDLPPDSTQFAWPDFAGLARALGGDGVTVRSEEDFPLMAKAIEARSQPLLVDIRLDPLAVPTAWRH